MKTRKKQFVIILFWRDLFVINPYNYYILPFFSSLYNLRLQYLSSTMLFLLVFVLFFFCFAILATWLLVFSFKIEGKVTSLAILFFFAKTNKKIYQWGSRALGGLVKNFASQHKENSIPENRVKKYCQKCYIQLRQRNSQEKVHQGLKFQIPTLSATDTVRSIGCRYFSLKKSYQVLYPWAHAASLSAT